MCLSHRDHTVRCKLSVSDNLVNVTIFLDEKKLNCIPIQNVFDTLCRFLNLRVLELSLKFQPISKFFGTFL